MFTSMEHLGHAEMSAKDAEAYKKLQETRRPELLKMAQKMKLLWSKKNKKGLQGHPPAQTDLVETIARKKGLFNG